MKTARIVYALGVIIVLAIFGNLHVKAWRELTIIKLEVIELQSMLLPAGAVLPVTSLPAPAINIGEEATVYNAIACEFSNYIEYEANVSGYCSCSKCCGCYSDGITASGHKIKWDDKFIAAPKEIPFGTMIDIPGYGCVPVLDRGGAIKGNKLDLYFNTHDVALKWGRKHIKVRMYIKEN